ncbi:MAG: hypothetical protein M3N95_11540, partial [Actinomycetota bacterium]|nr:hypothetical protein [Actinomycetota bacterium]
RHRHRTGPLNPDKTREERGLLSGQKRGPTPGHQWGLFHGHGHAAAPLLQQHSLDFLRGTANGNDTVNPTVGA